MANKIFSFRNLMIVLAVALLASCSTQYGGYGNNRNNGYYQKGGNYRYVNGKYYKNQGYYYDGRFYKEKRTPPGQAKKIYGDKSAKRYAPGQQNKNKVYSDRYNKNDKKYNKNNQNKKYRKNKKWDD